MQNEQNKAPQTFTQQDIDRIVSERLQRERDKISKEFETQRAELDRRAAMLNARASWQQKGLPVDLLESIDVSRPEALEAAEKALSAYVNAKKNEQPPAASNGQKDSANLPRFTNPLNDNSGSSGRHDPIRDAFKQKG